MIQTFAKMSRTAWIGKLENDLSVMRLALKKFKREIAEKESNFIGIESSRTGRTEKVS